MRKLIVVIFSLLWLTSTTQAAAVTATIDSWNKASLSGDVVPTMQVAFENTSHSGTRITNGHTATLTLSGWSAEVIKQVTMTMHSNQSAGAGSIQVSIDGQSVASLSGTFKQIAGAYSSSSVPVTCTIPWCICENSLEVTVSATENSLYLESITVTYLAADPMAQCVSFRCGDIQSAYTYCEEASADGILLPDLLDVLPDIAYDTDSWAFLGWVAKPYEDLSAPDYLPAGTRYYPSAPTTLYALFQESKTEYIPQDTLMQSGEYAIAIAGGDDFYCLAGPIEGTRIAAVSLPIHKDEQGYVLSVPYWPEEYRYRLTIAHDSVMMYHSQSQTWIGYTTKALSALQKPWLCFPAAHHSYFLYHHPTATEARMLYLDIDANKNFFFTDRAVLFNADAEGLLFFRVDNVPDYQPYIVYTTHPDWCTPVVQPKADKEATRIFRNGHIWIRSCGMEYDIVGHINTNRYE